MVAFKARDSLREKNLRVAVYINTCDYHVDRMLGGYQKLFELTPSWKLAGLYVDRNAKHISPWNRKGLVDMRIACQDGKVDMIITTTPSNFSRNCNTLHEILEELDTPVLFEVMDLYTGDEESRMILDMARTPA